NLLSNAIHHVGDDKRVTLRCIAQADGNVRVEVQDDGAGIAPEDLPHIFDKYYRSRADAGKVGTGLGLSITKAILVSHGYDFGVDSEAGKGSTFWFVTK
ncbi:MAG: sensor histidine kinase, partial [Ruthenibacterium sp.]